MNSILKQLLAYSIFIIAFSTASGQSDWHTDPYPVNENIDIIKYSFELRLSDETDEIKGNTDILVRFKNKENVLKLDLKSLHNNKGMTVGSVYTGESKLGFSHEDDVIEISCPVYESNDTIMLIRVSYSGEPQDGLIISENKFGKRSFFGDNWPDRARNWLPCVDHVSDKALVDFIVDAPSHYEVVSNGYLFQQFETEDDRKVSHWRSGVALPTKVMVIGVADFSYELAGFANGVPVQTWVYPENRKEGFFDYAPAVEVVEYFSSLLGDYAFEKLANVQSKTVYGGMENSGCIFYYENSVSGQGRVESLLAHEIAHQWFGDAVTEKDWHHIWLSEGFATYLTSVYMDEHKGYGEMSASMDRSRKRIIESFEKNPAPVVDPYIVNLRRLLSTNSYQKGAWILHMLRNELGDELFWDGIRYYYDKFKNRNALSEDFKFCMEEVSGKSLDSFFQQWLYVPGHPSVEVRWEWWPESKTVQVECIQQQGQFVFDFPLDLRISDKENEAISDTTIRISERNKMFFWPVSSKPANLSVDPEVKLLMELK